MLYDIAMVVSLLVNVALIGICLRMLAVCAKYSQDSQLFHQIEALRADFDRELEDIRNAQVLQQGELLQLEFKPAGYELEINHPVLAARRSNS